MPKRVPKKAEIDIKPIYSEKGQLAKLNIADPDALASHIQKDFMNAEQTKYLWIPQRAEDLKNYYGVTAPAEWPFKGASRIKSQFQRIVVDTLSGNILKSIFSPEHPIRVNPAPLGQGSDNETLDNLNYVENLHNSLQANEYNLRQVLDKAIPTALIESFVVLHPVYEYIENSVYLTFKRWIPENIKTEDLSYDIDTDSVTTRDGTFVHSINIDTVNQTPNELQDAGMREVTFDVSRDEVEKDGIAVKMINGYRFYMPLGTPGETPYEKVTRAPYVVHQLFYTIREVKDLIKKGYFENVDPVVATVYDRQRELLTYIKLQEAGFLLDTARLEYEYVEVLKWCGKWDIKGKETEITVWMDRGSTQILRAEINVLGMRPYFPITPFPVDETPYGESLVQIVRPLVKEIDLLMRTLINIALIKSAPPKFFDPASGFNPSTIISVGPNSWIPAREPARNIYQPNTPEDPAVSMQMLQFLVNIVERITGVNEVMQGQIANRANTTATEVQNALVRSGVRFDTIYERMRFQLKPMFKYIHKLTLRYMPEVKEMLMMGEENRGRLAKIHKLQLQGHYEMELAGNSVVMEQNELQNAMTMYNTIGQHPYVTYKPESIYYILYNIVKRLNPVAMNKILPKPDEIAQIERANQEAQRQQEQQAMQMQKGGDQAAKQQLEMQAQSHQVDLQAKAQEIQLKGVSHNQALRHKEQLHLEELKQKQAMAQIELNSKAQQAELQIAQMKARAYEARKATEGNYDSKP